MATDRLNILYFVVHDIGRHMGCYHVPVATPNLDTFAASGVTFNNVFCNSPCCTPSRICAMTGLYAHQSGGVGLAHMGWPLADEVPTIVDYFNQGGYETIHAGMQHERGRHQNRYQVDFQQDDSYHTANGVDEALSYLAERDRSRPFYLNIGSQQPHASTWHLADTMYGGVVPPEQVYIPPYLPDRPEIREAFGRFQAAIHYMDMHFGRLMEGLSRLGYEENTLVVFTTDHGISNWRSKSTLYDRGVEIALLMRLPDGRLAGTEVNHLLQNIDYVPTLLEATGLSVPEHLPGASFWPLLNGGANTEGAYNPHDAIFIERNFHGEVRYYGERPADAFEGYVDRYDPIRSVRTPDFHYIRYFDPGIKPRPWLPYEIPEDYESPTTSWGFCLPQPREPRPKEELFHVVHDKLEFVNVVDRLEHQEIRADLASRLQSWMASTDDFVLRDEVPVRPQAPGFH